MQTLPQLMFGSYVVRLAPTVATVTVVAVVTTVALNDCHAPTLVGASGTVAATTPTAMVLEC